MSMNRKSITDHLFQESQTVYNIKSLYYILGESLAAIPVRKEPGRIQSKHNV